MKKILSLRHWQLFILIVILGAWTSPSPLKEIINFISIATFATWIYSVGLYGQEKIKILGLESMKLTMFKITTLSIPIIFILLWTISPLKEDEGNWGIATILLGLLSVDLIYAVIYSIYFAAKTIVTVEKAKPVEFNDYIGTIILTVLFLVGVWIIQPKVNRLLTDEN